MMDFDEVTKAATVTDGLGVLPGCGATAHEHIIPLPLGMCPRSKNPIGGTISIRYQCDEALEVVTLFRFLKSASKAEGVRRLEGWGEHVTKACAKRLGSVVWATVDAEISPGPQRLIVKFSSNRGR